MNINVKNLSVIINNSTILNDISFELHSNHLTALVGPNGSGKSILMKTLLNEISPTSGHIDENLAQNISYLPQHLEDPPFLKAKEVVGMGFHNHQRTDSRERDAELKDILALCDIEDSADKEFTSLSGGEKQRTWLGFALAQRKPYLFLDEPFSAIDNWTKTAFYELMRQVVDTGRTILLVSHELDLIVNYADRILLIDQGALVQDGEAAEFKDQSTIQDLKISK
ncbi:MAG: ABC transporter ATP-binding protein [SAR202 cluster bacterium]|nr:ABC transporter ATP-binding protein [SAR202 cluster bacterium]|tara:strand:+ start:2420 stop:3094 length:675 start_codon:yes stop_codon:yes gene_type:complete